MPKPVLRILHLSSARTWRGGEQQIAYLYEELAQEGHQQYLFCLRGSAVAQYCSKHQIPHHTYRKGLSINPYVAYQIQAFCRREKIQLIHAHDSHSHSFACIAASLWGLDLPIVLSRRIYKAIRAAVFSQWKYNHPQIKAIICVSHAIRQIIQKRIQQPQQLFVVYDGIDLKRFGHQASGRLQKALNLKEDWPIIANVAAIAPPKDYFTFVDTAYEFLQRGRFAYFLLIGGDGGEQAAVEQYILEKGLGSHILLTGFREDIPEILPEIDLFLFTSKSEGLGSTLLDVMAAARPIVATDTGGIPELVKAEYNGLLAPVGDAPKLAAQLVRLLDDEALARRLSHNALEFVSAFDKSKMAQQTQAIYQKVLQR
ncbi:MAG: glycosyltransferase family 4 protein [Bacteroidota bacterium]